MTRIKGAAGMEHLPDQVDPRGSKKDVQGDPVPEQSAPTSSEDQDVHACGSMESPIFLNQEESRQFTFGVRWVVRIAAVTAFIAAAVVTCLYMAER